MGKLVNKIKNKYNSWKLDRDWQKIYESVGKRYKEEKWPETVVTRAGVDWYNGNISDYISNKYLVYDADCQAISIEDFYKNRGFRTAAKQINLDVLDYAVRCEDGTPSFKENYFIVGCKNMESLKQFEYPIVTDGPLADYYLYRAAYEKILNLIQPKKSLIHHTSLGSYYISNLDDITIPYKVPKLYFMDGSVFEGDFADLCILLNPDKTLQRLKEYYETLEKERKNIEILSKDVKKFFEKDQDMNTKKLYDEL